MKKAYVILSLLFIISFSALNAQQIMYSSKPGWYRIGQKSVDFKADRDEIVILGADKFKAIQLKVTDARVHFDDFFVIYNLPGVKEIFKEDINIRSDFKQGEKTRIIYLKYPCLKINKVVFMYRTVPNYRFEKARIEVYGLK